MRSSIFEGIEKDYDKQDLEKAKHYIDMIIERDYGDDTYRKSDQMTLCQMIYLSYERCDVLSKRKSERENNMTYEELQEKYQNY